MEHSIDREKVIAALHCRAYDDDFPCWECAYYKQDEKPVARCDYRGLMDDAIALLKEQEPVEPRIQTSCSGNGAWWYICGMCNTVIYPKDKYCHECGQAVKWE
mgnify:CR=1 FL=1